MAALPLYFLPLVLLLIAADALEPALHKIKKTSPPSEQIVIVETKDPVSVRLQAGPAESIDHTVHLTHSQRFKAVASTSSGSNERFKIKRPKVYMKLRQESSQSDEFIKNRNNNNDDSSSSSSMNLPKKKKAVKRNIYLSFPKSSKHKVIIASKTYKLKKEKSNVKNTNNDKFKDDSSLSSSSEPSMIRAKKGKLYVYSLKHKTGRGKVRYHIMAHKQTINHSFSSSSSSSSSSPSSSSSSCCSSSSSSSSSSSVSSSASKEERERKWSRRGKIATAHEKELPDPGRKSNKIRRFVHYQTKNNGNIPNGHYVVMKHPSRNRLITHHSIRHHSTSSSSSSSPLSSSSSDSTERRKRKGSKGKIAIAHEIKLPDTINKSNNIQGFVHYQTNNNGNVQNGHYAIVKKPSQNGLKTHYTIQHNVFGHGGKQMANEDPTAVVDAELKKLRAEYPWLNL